MLLGKNIRFFDNKNNKYKKNKYKNNKYKILVLL